MGAGYIDDIGDFGGSEIYQYGMMMVDIGHYAFQIP